MADLLTKNELAIWTGNDVGEVAADPFARETIEKVSEMVCFLGGHPDWTLEAGDDQAPVDVRMVVLQVCKRTYENPRQVVQEGNIGPLGGDRVLDVAAMLMELTDYERDTITKYNEDGDITGAANVFTITTTTAGSTTLQQTSPLYVGDNLQVGLADSDDPREWKIPLFNPGDPGDDANYDED